MRARSGASIPCCRGSPVAGLRYARGTVLLFAGRSHEAESDLRESIARGKGKGALQRAIALSNLGYALLDQERYAEASQSFEQSNTIGPASGSAFKGLAEVLLQQDQQPFEALRNVDRAVELKQFSRKTDRHMLAYMWANRAWALGKLGRTEEALAALQDAEKENTPNFVPGFAGAHWRMGMALIAMNRRAEALDHFRRANEADPHGNYGSRAAKAMRDFRS
jgi:tetratricopeptide (TPR) repeat protein